MSLPVNISTERGKHVHEGVWSWTHDEDCRMVNDDHSDACARRSAALMSLIQRHRDEAAAAVRAEQAVCHDADHITAMEGVEVVADLRAEVERLRAEFDHFYDFVNNTDPALVDAYLFMLNNTPEAIAARRAATTVAPAPAATERWTLVPGEDDDCPRCGRVKLRWVPPEYEPGGWVCDDCGWDSRDSRPVAPAPAMPEPRP